MKKNNTSKLTGRPFAHAPGPLRVAVNHLVGLLLPVYNARLSGLDVELEPGSLAAAEGVRALAPASSSFSRNDEVFQCVFDVFESYPGETYSDGGDEWRLEIVEDVVDRLAGGRYLFSLRFQQMANEPHLFLCCTEHPEHSLWLMVADGCYVVVGEVEANNRDAAASKAQQLVRTFIGLMAAQGLVAERRVDSRLVSEMSLLPWHGDEARFPLTGEMLTLLREIELTRPRLVDDLDERRARRSGLVAERQMRAVSAVLGSSSEDAEKERAGARCSGGGFAVAAHAASAVAEQRKHRPSGAYSTCGPSWGELEDLPVRPKPKKPKKPATTTVPTLHLTPPETEPAA